MRITIQFEKLDSAIWKALKYNTKVYEMNLPPFNQVCKLKGKSLLWQGKGQDKSYSWSYAEHTADILEVVGVWSNPKNTVKVVLAGDGWLAVFSREASADGFTSLDFDRYSDDPTDIFESTKEGALLVLTTDKGEGSVRNLLFVAGEPTLDKARELLFDLETMDSTRGKYARYRWKKEQFNLKSYGTVTTQELVVQEGVFNRALRNFRWVERKEKWDLWNAVKASITLKNTGRNLEIKLRALDGNRYTLKTPMSGKEDHISYGDASVFKQDYWIPFVYREPNSSFLGYQRAVMTEELLGRLLKVKDRLPEAKIIFGFNTRLVTLTRKVTSKGAVLSYLDGKIVKADDVKGKIMAFFIFAKPILVTPRQPSFKGTQRIMSPMAQALIDEGLNGEMKDLEGEFPFHLNIVYKEKQRKWYLEVAGKEFYIKGGYNALNKVKNATAGRAIIQHNEDGWDSKNTKVIRRRLGQLVGAKNALWIILHVKKMGALMKAMQGSGED